MNMTIFRILLFSFLFVIGYWGCVEIPSEGQTAPNYISEFRFIYTDPALPTVTVHYADGPSFTTFNDLPAGTFGMSSAYFTFFAGGKKILIDVGGAAVDPDTSSLTFSPDERGTVVVVPRDTVTKVRFLKLSERYIFAPTIGINDTTLLHFVNAVASRDTIDVRQDSSSVIRSVIDNLRFSQASSFIKVPKDSTFRFWVTKYNSTTARGTDTITVTGASNTQYTIVAYDTLARVRFTRFQDN